MIRDQQGHAVSDNPSDLSGWQLLHCMKHEPKVWRIYIRKIELNGDGSFLTVYCTYNPKAFATVFP
jgi:hypothetical protein